LRGPAKERTPASTKHVDKGRGNSLEGQTSKVNDTQKTQKPKNTLGPSGLEIVEPVRRPLPYVEVPALRTKPISGGRAKAPEKTPAAKETVDLKKARKDLVISIIREIFSLPHPVRFSDLLKMSPIAKQAASEMLRQNRIARTKEGLVTNVQEACYEDLMEVNSQLGLGPGALLDDIECIYSQMAETPSSGSTSSPSRAATVEEVPEETARVEQEIVEVLLQDLPMPDFYSSDGLGEVPRGGIVIPDPVEAFLQENGGTRVKGTVTASESEKIRVFYPTVNNARREECIFDEGSQVCSASEAAAQALGISWDPDLTIGLQSSNRTTARTLGLARNVPINCGNDVTAYVQLHIVRDAAYKLLLGRPFLSVMSAQSNNYSDGKHTITLTDPNNLNRIVVPSFPRGEIPEQYREELQTSFQTSRI